jgi:hypothetical protein
MNSPPVSLGQAIPSLQIEVVSDLLELALAIVVDADFTGTKVGLCSASTVRLIRLPAAASNSSESKLNSTYTAWLD